MELIEQWLTEPWVLWGIITAVAVLLLWKLFYRRRYDDEIYLSDKDLYNQQYFDDSPAYKDDEIIDSSVLDFEEKNSLTETEQTPAILAEDQNNTASERMDNTHSTETSYPMDEEFEEKPPKELIIAINICSIREEGISGEDIFAAMEELGIQHGRMNIFHHYGIEKQATLDPVFSIANLLKPGTFNPDEQDHFTTPGLVAFLQLPGPLGGRVAFELMLHYTQRLAELLQGRLEDDRKQAIDAELIDFMRKNIDDFE